MKNPHTSTNIRKALGKHVAILETAVCFLDQLATTGETLSFVPCSDRAVALALAAEFNSQVTRNSKNRSGFYVGGYQVSERGR